MLSVPALTGGAGSKPGLWMVPGSVTNPKYLNLVFDDLIHGDVRPWSENEFPRVVDHANPTPARKCSQFRDAIKNGLATRLAASGLSLRM
jgi:hypothetical protein